MLELTIENILDALKECRTENYNEYDLQKKVNSISIDTRKIQAGSLYIPIIGENFDGHNFIENAFNNGAIVCLSEKDIKSELGIIIKVKSTKEALKDLAEYYLNLFDLPVIAITGSVGKTSCKDMISSVLSTKYNVLKTEGNFNNEIGLPLTVFKLEKEHDVIVLEMGMNHFNEIYSLSKIAKPSICVISNIGVSHIENLGSQDGILKAKSEIFAFMKEDGLAIINGDDDYLLKIKDKIHNKYTFGLHKNNDYYCENIQVLGFEGTKGYVHTPKNNYEIMLKVIGKHMIYNTLPAIIIGEKLGLSNEQIQKGILDFVPTKMRLNIYSSDGITIIDDAYNASPDSMKSAVNTLVSLGSENKHVAILGDMFELGEYSIEAHKIVGKHVASSNIDLLICVGNDAKFIYEEALNNGMNQENLKYYADKDEVIKEINSIILDKDIVLVKASRGMHLEKIIDKIKVREVH